MGENYKGGIGSGRFGEYENTESQQVEIKMRAKGKE